MLQKYFFDWSIDIFQSLIGYIKIFNRNTVKVSYSCIQSMSKIYKGHNSKVTFTPCNQLTLCNCRVKGEYLTDGKCETVDVVYHCRVTSPKPQKIYFGLAEKKWKQRYYNHKNSITNDIYMGRHFQVMCDIWRKL